MDKVECVVIGAGVIGLAIARRLALAGREVIILEAAEGIGTVTSSRNSEVIHAGIYYPAGSLMARMCVSGKRALYQYCREHGIPHRNCGKLIVATTPKESEKLQSIRAHAEANGVLDMQTLSGDAARALEPALNCDAALLSPSTGIIDSHAYMLALRGNAEDAGAAFAFHTPLLGARRVHLIVDVVDPFDVRAEARLAGHVEREVDAEPAGLRYRIDQARERRLLAAAEVIALGEISGRDLFDRHALDDARRRRRIEAGGVDEKVACERHWRFAAGFELDDPATGLRTQERRVKREGRTGILGVAAQRQHIGVAVDDPGRR